MVITFIGSILDVSIPIAIAMCLLVSGFDINAVGFRISFLATVFVLYVATYSIIKSKNIILFDLLGYSNG